MYRNIIILRSKDSARREQGKGKAEGFYLALLSRSLYYLKIVQGEGKDQRKAEGFYLALPSPSRDTGNPCSYFIHIFLLIFQKLYPADK